MSRLAAVLLSVLVVCALSVVSSQHRARKLFVALQAEQDRALRLDDEWGQLQLEQRTWSESARIEKMATQTLRMRVPDEKRIHALLGKHELSADAGRGGGR